MCLLSSFNNYCSINIKPKSIGRKSKEKERKKMLKQNIATVLYKASSVKSAAIFAIRNDSDQACAIHSATRTAPSQRLALLESMHERVRNTHSSMQTCVNLECVCYKRTIFFCLFFLSFYGDIFSFLSCLLFFEFTA